MMQITDTVVQEEPAPHAQIRRGLTLPDCFKKDESFIRNELQFKYA